MARFAHVPVEEWPVQEVQYLAPAKCVGTTQDERRAFSVEYWDRCDPEHAELVPERRPLLPYNGHGGRVQERP